MNNPEEKYDRLLINLSNHPTTLWSEEQQFAALIYGEFMDLPFPRIDPRGDTEYIKRLVDEYFESIKQISKNRKTTIHLMGEMTFTFALLNKLLSEGIDCIASTSERKVIELGSGKSETIFSFVQFRKYILYPDRI